jgi:REP element-mobilizing transposase RayT
MRQSRIRGTGLSYYHVISRIVDRRFILNDEEREHFVVLMRKLEAFLGLRVVTYVVMSNHFHLLVEEPDRDELPALDRETLLQRLGYLYDHSTVDTVRDELDRAAARGDLQWEQQIIERYERRMGDISIFMKELKQRFCPAARDLRFRFAVSPGPVGLRWQGPMAQSPGGSQRHALGRALQEPPRRGR